MDKERSVGIWIYGIAFLILGLTALILSVWSFNVGAREGFQELMFLWLVFSIFLMIIGSALLLLGTLPLLLKAHYLIIIFLWILIFISLFSMLITGTSFYKFYSIALTLFFVSALYFFIHPNVNEQFK